MGILLSRHQKSEFRDRRHIQKNGAPSEKLTVHHLSKLFNFVDMPTIPSANGRQMGGNRKGSPLEPASLIGFILVSLQNGHERFLRDIHFPNSLHPLFPNFLFL